MDGLGITGCLSRISERRANRFSAEEKRMIIMRVKAPDIDLPGASLSLYIRRVRAVFLLWYF